jgi:FlaG/FlaF family flagellin (archaellin)
MSKKFKIKNKAMSEVITTVLMIGLVLALIGITWGVINNMVHKELENTQSCFGNFDKVSINGAYTCYNITTKEFYFSISVGDIELDKVFVAIGSQGSTYSLNLNSTSTDIPRVTNYPLNNTGITAPTSNSGKTYIYAGFATAPDYIRVSPVIGDEKCQESDALTNIEICSV